MFYLFIQLNLILIIELEAEVKSRAYCISFSAKNPIICRDRTFLRNTQFSCGNVQALNFMESKLKSLLELSETLMPTICINFKKNFNIFPKKPRMLVRFLTCHLNSWTEFSETPETTPSAHRAENFHSPLADTGFTILIYSELYSLYFLVLNRVLYCNHS